MPTRILVVDAVATNRILWKVKLRAAYHQIFTADDVATALGQLRLNRPDIVVLGAGGSDLIQSIRSDPAGLDVPIILLGEQASPMQPASLLRLGADEVLPPPVSETTLLAHIRHLLKRKQTLQLAVSEPTPWGLSEPAQRSLGKPHSRAIMIGDQNHTREWRAKLAAFCEFEVHSCHPLDAMDAIHGETDLVLIHSGTAPSDLISAILHSPNLSKRPLVVILSSGPNALEYLDQGVDAVLSPAMHLDELSARFQRLFARKAQSVQQNLALHQRLNESIHDPLTGLLNRRGLKRRIAGMPQTTPLSLVMADVDHFKRINDAHGHAAGDAVLIMLARLFSRNLRQADLCARYGGEEFLFALPNTDHASSFDLANRLCQAARNTPVRLPDNSTLNVSLSFGVSAVPQRAMSLNDHIALADKAMYRAKQSGRDTVILADA